MDVLALLQGTPFDRCTCLVNDTLHYHADFLFAMAILHAEQWRMRPLKLLSSPRVVTWSAPGGDDLDWSRATAIDDY